VPTLASFFGAPIRVIVPNELTSEAELLKFLALSTAELKKIWWFRGRMYQKFEISEREGKTRVISAPDRRLKMLQTNDRVLARADIQTEESRSWLRRRPFSQNERHGSSP